MTDIDKTIPVWVDNDGVKTQVGWATPDNGSGVRKINLLNGFDNTALKDVHFGDVDSFETELEPAETQEPPRTFQEFASEPFVDIDGVVLAPALDETPGFVDTTPEAVNGTTFQDPEVEVTPEAPLPSEPIEEVPNEELAAEPIDAGVAPEDDGIVIEGEIVEEDPQDDSGDAEDVTAGFEPVSAASEPEQSEDPAQP